MKRLLSIVLPAYNEELGVSKTIQEIPVKEISKKGFKTEIIVVDNNSTDQTSKIARDLGVIVLKEKKQGYGFAVRKGLNNCRGDLILVCDADGAHPMRTIPELLGIFTARNLEFLTTNRFFSFRSASKATSLPNQFGNLFLFLLFRSLFGLRLVDSQSGMFLLKKSVWPKLNVRTNHYDFCQEIKIDAIYYLNCRWYEVGICCDLRLGRSKIRRLVNGFENVAGLFKKRIAR